MTHPLVSACNTNVLLSTSSAMSRYTSLSNLQIHQPYPLTCTLTQSKYLPGRNKLGSRRSGLLVAPMMKMPSLDCSPSNSANNCDTILVTFDCGCEFITNTIFMIYLSITPPESPLLPLLGAKLSISSKNITHGVAVFARANTIVCVHHCVTTRG